MRRACIAAMILLGSLVGRAAADEWPSRSITMVVPLAAGGGADAVARVLAVRLGDILGQSVVVENIGGAGGMVGSSRVAKAAPDGYQILLGTVGTHAQSQTLYKKPLYDSKKDFESVALVAELPIVLVVTNSMPVNTLAEFTSYSKKNQGKLQYGSPGAGSSNHLACLLMNARLGVDVTHVPYRRSPELFQDLISGRIDYFCPTSTAALPLVTAQQVRPIVVLGSKRLDIFPALPSAAEQGFRDFETGTWFALFLPKGTPEGIVRKLNDATIKAMTTESVAARLREIGASTVSKERMSPEYLGKFVAEEVEKWAEPIRRTGIIID
jgi:tripartite-type tricarboxylate transporter receptor subunit TctC